MKKLLPLLLILVLLCTFVAGCENAVEEKRNAKDNSEQNDEKSNTDDQKESVNLSQYSFINVRWHRNIDSCSEVLYFKSNGDWSYYCDGGGHPINDDDFAEGFRFDPETNTIHLDFSETFPNTVTEVNVVTYTDDVLVLDFDGEERVFYRNPSYWVSKNDLSAYNFVDRYWKREVFGCTETLYFYTDGQIYYSCDCFSPENHNDFSPQYQYYDFDAETNTIKLIDYNTYPIEIEELPLLSCDDEMLIIEFPDRARTFFIADDE